MEPDAFQTSNAAHSDERNDGEPKTMEYNTHGSIAANIVGSTAIFPKEKTYYLRQVI